MGWRWLGRFFFVCVCVKRASVKAGGAPAHNRPHPKPGRVCERPGTTWSEPGKEDGEAGRGVGCGGGGGWVVNRKGQYQLAGQLQIACGNEDLSALVVIETRYCDPAHESKIMGRERGGGGEWERGGRGRERGDMEREERGGWRERERGEMERERGWARQRHREREAQKERAGREEGVEGESETEREMGRNPSNVSALNRSQKRRFMMVYYVLLRFI